MQGVEWLRTKRMTYLLTKIDNDENKTVKKKDECCNERRQKKQIQRNWKQKKWTGQENGTLQENKKKCKRKMQWKKMKECTKVLKRNERVFKIL